MNNAKVLSSEELLKLKEVKKATAKKCCIDGCGKIGAWDSKKQNFYLLNGMCFMHYKRFRKHGDANIVLHLKDGQTNHPLYNTLQNIKYRILDVNSTSYPRYGGRGLKMEMRWCEPVYGFHNFLEDIAYLGDRPEGHTLDRIENNLGYFVGNLKWSNDHQQGANRRSNNKTVGVRYESDRNKWKAEIKVKGNYFIKRVDTEHEAIDQRKAWEVEFNITY